MRKINLWELPDAFFALEGGQGLACVWSVFKLLDIKISVKDVIKYSGYKVMGLCYTIGLANVFYHKKLDFTFYSKVDQGVGGFENDLYLNIPEVNKVVSNEYGIAFLKDRFECGICLCFLDTPNGDGAFDIIYGFNDGNVELMFGIDGLGCVLTESQFCELWHSQGIFAQFIHIPA